MSSSTGGKVAILQFLLNSIWLSRNSAVRPLKPLKSGAAAMEGSLEVQDKVFVINCREITPEDDLKYVQDFLDTDEEPLIVDGCVQ